MSTTIAETVRERLQHAEIERLQYERDRAVNDAVILIDENARLRARLHAAELARDHTSNINNRLQAENAELREAILNVHSKLRAGHNAAEVKILKMILDRALTHNVEG